MKTFDTFKKHDFDTRRQILLSNLVISVDDESGEHYESEDIKEFESLLIGVIYA